MRKILSAMILAALPVLSFALPVAKNGEDFVVLYPTSCANKDILDLTVALGEGELDWFRAETMFDGVKYEACWHEPQGDGMVHLVYADGDQGMISAREFKEAGV